MSNKAIGQLDAAARARSIERSEFLRKVLESNLAESIDMVEESRRQSLLVSRRESEQDAMAFIEATMSSDGWE